MQLQKQDYQNHPKTSETLLRLLWLTAFLLGNQIINGQLLHVCMFAVLSAHVCAKWRHNLCRLGAPEARTKPEVPT